jgi:hypothetical protein
MSLRPDSSVGRTERIFARYGAGFILVAKFVPGLSTIVPPLAGIAGIGRARFAIYEVGGVLLWAGTWVGLGYYLSDAVSSIALAATRLGRLMAVIIVAAIAAYVIVRYVRRRVRLRAFRPVPSVAERLEGTPYAVPASGPDAIGRDGDQEGHGESRGDTRVTAVARRAA